MKENYFSVKNRGSISADFIPLIENSSDPTRKFFDLKSKKTVILYPETIYNYLNNKPLYLEYKNEKSNENVKLTTIQEAENWTWEIVVNDGQKKDHRKVVVGPSENFYVHKLFNFAIPYIFGWYAVGDSRLAEQSIAKTEEIKDPFQDI